MNDFTRRDFLRVVGGASMAVVGGSALAGCTRRGGPVATAGTATGTPRRGGMLRIGMVGAGKSETFSPAGATQSLISVARTTAVFDPLINVGPDLTVLPGLATSWKSDAEHATWTFTIRQGVTWHDGSPLTVDDVVYSIRWSAGNALASAVDNVDLGKVRTSGHDVIVPLKQPDLLFPQNLSNIWVVQNGVTDFTKPVGTGPFRFVSFTPGERSVCDRNPAYWDAPRPYVDSLVIQSIDDDTARVNALMGGQIDVLGNLPFTQAATAQGITLLRTPSLTAQAFYMAVDQKPFDDPRVRQAVRLLADRQQLVDVALNGYGTVANDLYGKGLPFYAGALPQRTRDVAEAKALLAAAGHGDGLALSLQTSAASPGMTEAATLFAQQAKDGGVTVNVSNVDPGAYFDPSQQYLKLPFAQTVWSGFSTLSSFYRYALLPGGSGNETHWTDPQTASAIDGASAAGTDAAAATLWQQVQQQQYDEGGYLWWANIDNVDACSSKVAGITPSKYLAMGLPQSLTTAYFSS